MLIYRPYCFVYMCDKSWASFYHVQNTWINSYEEFYKNQKCLPLRELSYNTSHVQKESSLQMYYFLHKWHKYQGQVCDQIVICVMQCNFSYLVWIFFVHNKAYNSLFNGKSIITKHDTNKSSFMLSLSFFLFLYFFQTSLFCVISFKKGICCNRAPFSS